MFEYVRTHKRIMQGLLLLLIFPSFAFFGIESYLRSEANRTALATVAGQTISLQEFEQEQKTQLDNLKQMYGPDFDAQMLNTPEQKKRILDDLVARKAIEAEVRSSHIVTSDDALLKNLNSVASLKKADGTIDKDLYMNLLARQGLTPQMYDDLQRKDLAIQQLVGALQNSSFVSKSLAQRVSQIYEQEREVQSITYKASDFSSQIKLTEAALRAYYDKNAAQFEIPENLKAEYVVLSLDALSANINVSDAEIAAHYEQNKATYTTPEQRRASHILLSLDKSASAADAKAVTEKAQALLAQVRKNPESFAKVAKENSQDPGSAEVGGDLNYFARGAMVKEFDAAAFKMKQGEISDLVKTDYGIHIIQLTEIKSTAIKPLDEVKTQLAAEIKKQKAQKAYTEAAETFTNTVYEQADSLKPVVEKLGLKIETAANLTRNANPAMGTAPVNNPKFLKAIFSDDSIKKKTNTEAVEVAPNTLVAGRIVEYKPVSKRPFEEVKAAIEARVLATESIALAKKNGEDKISALKAKDELAGFGDVKLVSRLKNQAVPPEAFAALLKADVQKLPTYVGVEIPNVGYEVFRINKVIAGEENAERRANEHKQLSNAIAQQELFSYVEALRKKAKVKINTSLLNSKSSANTQ
jgi:peptidyl-prolyl cis-trans isomerase D